MLFRSGDPAVLPAAGEIPALLPALVERGVFVAEQLIVPVDVAGALRPGLHLHLVKQTVAALLLLGDGRSLRLAFCIFGRIAVGNAPLTDDDRRIFRGLLQQTLLGIDVDLIDGRLVDGDEHLHREDVDVGNSIIQ